MLNKALGVSTGLLVSCLPVLGQGVSRIDTIHSSSSNLLCEYHVEVPLGQTFVKNGGCQSFSTVRFHVPDAKNKPELSLHTVGNKMIPIIAMGSPGTATHCKASMMRGATSSVTAVRSSSMTVDDDPQRYLMELRADPAVPTKMVMNLGYGSAWLDLSGMDVRGLDVQSGNADVFITYKSPNTHPMTMLNLKGGMGKFVVRNIEMARAENVILENGMGNTKIIVGETAYNKTNIALQVGTGACTLLVHEKYPVKIILNSSMLSKVELPENLIETTDNTFVNLAYKANPQNAMTITVDVSMGTFYMVAFE